MRSGVTGLEHRLATRRALCERLGAGLERLILDHAEARDERAGLVVGLGATSGASFIGCAVSLMGYEYSPGATSSA